MGQQRWQWMRFAGIFLLAAMRGGMGAMGQTRRGAAPLRSPRRILRQNVLCTIDIVPGVDGFSPVALDVNAAANRFARDLLQ